MKIIFYFVIVFQFFGCSYSKVCPDPGCPPGKYMNMGNCDDCLPDCRNCTDLISGCSDCFAWYSKTNPVSNVLKCAYQDKGDEEGQRKCDKGQYIDPYAPTEEKSYTCLPCSYGCEQCDGPDDCLKCKITMYRTRNYTTCNYYCKDFPCTRGKENCYGCNADKDLNNCIACMPGYYYNGFSNTCERTPEEDLCPVPAGETQGYWYKDENDTCLICDLNCTTCTRNSQNCTSCVEGYEVGMANSTLYNKIQDMCVPSKTTKGNSTGGDIGPGFDWVGLIIQILIYIIAVLVICSPIGLVLYCVLQNRDGTVGQPYQWDPDYEIEMKRDVYSDSDSD